MSDGRCDEFRELVSAFIDERLDGGELLRLEEHLQTCGGCRAFAVDLRRLKGMLRAAETFRPLRPPPAGFAAMVAARLGQSGARAIPFPEVRARRRGSRHSWLGLAAAAAAAILFFTWSWQRLLDGESLTRKLAVRPAGPAVVVMASTAGEGDIETWLHEHAMVARDGTLLGPAEEVEFAGFSAGPVPEP